jgi:acetylglutamate kinase
MVDARASSTVQPRTLRTLPANTAESWGLDHAVAKLQGQSVVICYGGAAMDQPHLRDLFAHDVALLWSVGVNPVIIHGGGRRIARLMESPGKTAGLVTGTRKTDDEIMVLVETALRQVNAEVVELFTRHRARAAGFGGWEMSVIRAAAHPPVLPAGEIANQGRVGDVGSVNPKPIRALQERRTIPVIASLGIGEDTLTYAITPEVVAGEVAAILGAAIVIYLSDVPGVMAPDGCRYRRLSRWVADSLVREGALDASMLPTIEGAVRALKGGAGQAYVVDGRVPHALLGPSGLDSSRAPRSFFEERDPGERRSHAPIKTGTGHASSTARVTEVAKRSRSG